MKKYFTFILVLITLQVVAQTYPITGINISLPANPDANTANWKSGTSLLTISATTLAENGSVAPLVLDSKILVTIKKGGVKAYGDYTINTAPASNFDTPNKIYKGDSAVSFIGKSFILAPGDYEICVQFFGNGAAGLTPISEEKTKAFSIIFTSSVCGTKFNDANGDGVQDNGETGLPGWTINLTSSGAAGPVTITTTTGADGSYCFNNLTANTYTVSETPIDGWLQMSPAAPGTYPVKLGSGMNVINQDFGNQQITPCIYLCNTSFEEILNGQAPSGYVQTSQDNIPCWQTTASDGRIEIWHTGFGTVPAYSGTYFAELNATQVGTLYQSFYAGVANQSVIVSFAHRGRYAGNDVMEVLIVAPDGTSTPLGTFTDNNTAWTYYSAPYTILTPGTYTLKFVSVSSNNGAGPADGGNFLDAINVTCPASICGTKFNDVNGDGIQNNGETGLPNWTINLNYTDAAGTPVTLTTTTDADGNYCFNNLPAMTYTFSETQQSGWTQTYPAAPGTYSVTLTEGQSVTGKNFGNHVCIPTITGSTSGSTCGTGTVSLGATASAGTINWYGTLTGGTLLGTGTSFTTPAISATTTYYVDATNDCGTTAARTAIVATVNALPVVSAPVSVNVGSTVTLSPTSGGTWTSSDQSIAMVTDAGVVTGLSAGTATFTFTDTITGCSATTSSITVTATTNTPCIYLCNPDFEQFSGVTPPSGYSWFPQANIPCWNTTASDGQIEIWHSGYGNVPAYSGTYFAELNATQTGTLYQTFTATAPQSVIVSFAHRGRYPGVDVMKVSIVDPGGTSTPLGTYSDNISAWHFYSTAAYPISGSGNYTIKFESVSSNNGSGPADGGNFLDDINVTCPASICGIKYNDLNGDGQKQANEPILPNWEITLTGPLTMTTTTGADGSYCFNNLPAGSYTIQETQQSGWVQVSPAAPGTYSLNITEDQHVVGKDFGNRQLLNPSCTDFEDGTNGGWQLTNTFSSIILDGANHYLHTTDQSGASTLFNNSAPLTGNWTNLLANGCGSLCFDVNFIFAGNPWAGVYPPSTFTPYIAISGNGFSAYFLITNPISAGSGWHSYCAPLAYLNLDGTLPSNSDGQWIMGTGSNSDWNSLLSNVTQVNLPVDPTSYQGEQFGYDNICLKNTGDCIVPCCDKVTVVPVLDAAGKPMCSAKITATCEVKSIDVIVSNGTLNTVTWNCPTAVPTGYSGQSTYSFAPGTCIPEMTTSINATTSGIVTITYDITFSSGEKCRKTVEVDCGATCCDQVKVDPVVDAAGKASCSAKITANCQVKAIAVTVTNGTLSSVSWNCSTAIPTGYIGQSTYTFAPGNCNPEMTTSVDATTSGTVTITYDITFSNGETCQKKVDLDCSIPSCCEGVIVEPVAGAEGVAACCAKITTTCEVKSILVNVTNGTLSSASWNCTTPIPSNYIGTNTYTFAPGGCIPVLTTCVDATNSGIVTITYVIGFSNGETCRKTIQLDCAVAPNCVTPPTGMVLWLPGDGNALDISGLNNNGTLSGGTTYSSGKVAGAFKIGNYLDKISIADNSSLNFGTGNFSADAWFKTTDNIHAITIADKSVPVGSNMTGYRLLIYQGYLYFQMGDGSLPLSQWVSTVQLADGAWHFVAVTVDRKLTDGGKLYIDGLPALTFDPTSKPGSISNTIPLTVAGNNMVNFTASDHYTFYLDEVELFNREITDTEIASIYNAGSAGKCKLGSICGTKFNDLNGNGRRDDGEPGIPDWKIVIGGTADLSAVTDKDGNFCFYNLESGEYKISEEVRDGWQEILPAAPGTYTVTLPAGQSLSGILFGNRLIPQTGSICGSKFNDLNGNGIRNEGEPGIGDWTILLGGDADLTVTTDKNGDFCFDNLKPGTYKLGEESRTGWLQMKPAGGSYNIILAGGDNVIGQDFGNMLDSKPASICGTKFNDLNGNGTQDPNEPGLTNWTISLSGSATMTAVTDKKGNYCFTDLKPGTYTVSEVNQPLWHQTAPHPTGDYTVTLAASENLENQNFGNQHDLECVTPPVGMLGWWPGDDNANDITLNGDFGTLVNGATFAPGMVGPAFSLMGSTDYVNIPDRPQLNPGGGDFTIDCWMNTSQAKGIYAILDKRGLDANQNISGYVLYVDDGHLQLRLSDSAGNGVAETIYNGGNANIADGQWHFVAATVEQGTSQKVTLFIDGAIVSTNSFGLPYLNYSNTVALRIGEAYFSAYSQNVPGHYHNLQGMIDEVEFIFGAVSDTELAGIFNAGSAGKCKPDVLLGSICGTKFNDLNGNGIRDARGDGEPGLAGWHINLTGAATMSTTTDANGNFCFNNLPAGQYTIAEVNQPGWIQTAPQNPNTFTVTLTPGGHIQLLNFGNKVDPAFGCVQAPSGLVGWWPFDGHAKDISGINNHGTLIGTASYVNGKVDPGLNVNSTTDYISVPDNSSLNFGTGNLSIDAWVNFEDTTVWGYIAFKEDISESNFLNSIGYNFGIDSKKLSFHMGSGIPSAVQQTSALIGAGKWYFVAVTVDRTSKTGGKMYINGSLVSTFDPTSVSNSISNTKPLIIASFSQGAPKSVNRVDEVEIFNRSLTADEITSIFNAGSFGKCKLGTICGMKFNDLNGNGKKDEGEPGIADWQINLGGPVDMIVRTEKDGSFCFTNLNPGDYKLTEELRGGWTQTTPGAPGNFTVKLPAGRNLTGYYFGNTYRNTTGCVTPPSGMVAWWTLDETDISKTGSVSNDLAGFNNIGTRINGPTPLAGKVLGGLQFNGTNNYVEVPDQPELNFGTGDFSFDAWIQTTDNGLGKIIVDKRISAANFVGYAFYLNEGKLSLIMADGSFTSYVSPIFVADGKWHHIAVTVSRSDKLGINFYLDGVQTQFGDPTTRMGSLDNNSPLRIGAELFTVITGFMKGTLDEIELFNRVLTKDEINSIFNAGSSGKCKLGSICGTKFNDLNGNGRRDESEPGIPDWRIMLDGTANLSTTTDKDGNYCFTNLIAGDYKIHEELRPDWQQKVPATGYYGVTLGSGENIAGKDFGNMLNSQLGSICGMKFNDLNGNGIRDKDEPGIPDWTILIGGTADFTVQTDKNGEFCLTNLKPGTYKIGEQMRQGWIQTAPSEHYFTIELEAGQQITKLEFGNLLDPQTGSICGMKFNDANGNGIMDNGEQGIPDWTINLTGTVTQTMQTDKSGNYCFTKLPAGTYTIAEGSRSGWFQTAPASNTYSFKLNPGESVVRMNFGNTIDPCYNETKSWSALGSGMNSYVRALAVMNGKLFAGGSFSNAGGVTASRIAEWNGTNWSPLGVGTNWFVSTLSVMGSVLYAGGEFSTAGGISANHIAKWDGTAWSSLGNGMNSNIDALEVIGQQLYAKGTFSTADGLPANRIARWDGTGWFPLGNGINNSGIESSLESNGSILYVGGYFNTAGGVSANNIAKWDVANSNWSPLGSGINGGVVALVEKGGELYAGGGFTTAGGLPANNIAKWNGTTWLPLGSGTNGKVFALAFIGSDLYVGGDFTTAGGITVNGVAKWDGTNWSSLGSGMASSTGVNSFIYALAVNGSDLYAAGSFISAGGISAKNIAKYSCDKPNSVGEVKLQQSYELDQNYPNPFSSTSIIGYSVPQTSFVNISVYDIFGKEIKVLVNEEIDPGHHEIVFDRKDFASGIYFYTLKTAGFIQSKKMILMK